MKHIILSIGAALVFLTSTTSCASVSVDTERFTPSIISSAPKQFIGVGPGPNIIVLGDYVFKYSGTLRGALVEFLDDAHNNAHVQKSMGSDGNEYAYYIGNKLQQFTSAECVTKQQEYSDITFNELTRTNLPLIHYSTIITSPEHAYFSIELEPAYNINQTSCAPRLEAEYFFLDSSSAEQLLTEIDLSK